MSTLKDRQKDNLMIAKQIYNARHRYKKIIRDSDNINATLVEVFERQ